jgi:hypothetical protein
MSICIVALVVLAFMGIFSAKYRKWAKEAFGCVARRVVFRPCKTGFNERVKAVVVGSILKRNQKLAGVTYRHFEAISWIFTIIFLLSMVFTVYGFYNIAVYGTCDPSNPDTCVFTPSTPQCSADCQPCQCGSEPVGCDSPDYKACNGNCTCVQAVCSGSMQK